jgi:adenosine deaminase CECR1
MGVLCSTVDKEGDDPPESKAQVELHSTTPRKLVKMPQIGRPGTRSQSYRVAISGRDFETQTAYDKARESLQAAERAVGFDADVVAKASSIENQAVKILQKIRLHDWDHVYGRPFDATGTSTGMRTVGQHFLGNVDHINKTWLMDVARRMPKGAHLHIHFNSCLPAKFLIRQARDIKAMYIRSTVPLTTPENWAASRISFMVMTPHEATHIKATDGTEKHVPLGNIWDPDYVSNTWMSYKEFQNKFEFTSSDGEVLRKTEGAETWLERKMQISEEEAHGTHQTGRG